MNAGRELDALVAERVMGWMRSPDNYWHQGGDAFYLKPPSYSTDIAAAWKVVEGMVVLGYGGSVDVVVSQGTVLDYGATFRGQNISHGSSAKTAPHAICLAALAAVGAEVPA